MTGAVYRSRVAHRRQAPNDADDPIKLGPCASARYLPCADCGAPVGVDCRSTTGGRLARPHRPRLHQARRALLDAHTAALAWADSCEH